jgi:Protein of unknown function (DUF3800)
MPTQSKKQKLYCYIDETGQDTKGTLFLVAVVITAEDTEQLRRRLEHIEQESQKGTDKWVKTNPQRRQAYLRQVIETPLFFDKIRFAHYRATSEYQHLTILTVARAILEKARAPYEATVFIDGLGKTERRRVSTGLRQLQVRVRKVRGLSDQADPLIRLADAMAGFIRNYLEGDERLTALYAQAVKTGVLKELK